MVYPQSEGLETEKKPSFLDRFRKPKPVIVESTDAPVTSTPVEKPKPKSGWERLKDLVKGKKDDDKDKENQGCYRSTQNKLYKDAHDTEKEPPQYQICSPTMTCSDSLKCSTDIFGTKAFKRGYCLPQTKYDEAMKIYGDCSVAEAAATTPVVSDPLPPQIPVV
jgi:hypothetical protein